MMLIVESFIFFYHHEVSAMLYNGGCTWHMWQAFMRLHHIIASYCIAQHSWMSPLTGRNRTGTALYVARGGV
jgi:hypothetical protein